MSGKAHSFEEFYADKIEPYINSYAKTSRSANNKALIALLITMLAVAFFFWFLGAEEGSPIIFISLALLVVSIYLWYDHLRSENDFNKFFKEKIIGEILDFVLPGAQLDPQAFIEKKYFKQSSLFRRKLNFYVGNDHITATYKAVSFEACELNTDSLAGEDGGEPLFRGIFMKAAISGITGGTYIWPVDDVQLPRTIADDHFERLNPLHQVFRIASGAPVFDNHFAVYTSFPEEANAILTEERMQGMLNLKKQFKKDVRFSFVPGSFYATVANNSDLLEPVNSLKDKEYIKGYFYSILAYPAVINQLKLYEYI